MVFFHLFVFSIFVYVMLYVFDSDLVTYSNDPIENSALLGDDLKEETLPEAKSEKERLGEVDVGRLDEQDELKDKGAHVFSGAVPEMVVIPVGRFRMGCVSGKDCSPDEVPVHEVTIDQPFAMSKYEVTFAQWDACVVDGGCGGYKPSDQGWGRGNRPVINVSWKDATGYAEWLSRKTGKRYRLPSEAEWEYAARSGSTTKYHFGDDESQLCRYANHRDRSTNLSFSNESCSDGVGERTAEVGSYQPNSFGLYDMHGNVWEWVQDCYNWSYAGAPSDGSAWISGDCDGRVLRGGSHYVEPIYLRSRWRSAASIDGDGDFEIGFRVVKVFG